MTEEIRENANKEAELITAQAVIDGEKIVADARTELARVSEESRSLKLQKTRLLSEIKTVVESHRRLLEAQEELDRGLQRLVKGAIFDEEAMKEVADR